MKFEYYCQGQGEPLLFLGGANTTIRFYQRFLTALSRYYKVYFFNYPGFGQTDHPTCHNLSTYLTAVDQFIHDHHLQNFHLAGSSFGGYLAATYTHLKQPKIKSLILFSPLTRLPSRSLLGMAVRMIKGYLHKSSHNNQSFTSNMFDWSNFQDAGEKFCHSLFVISCELHKSAISDTVPTLVILGEEDRVVDNAYTQTLFSHRKNAKVIVLPNQGHNSFATIGDKIFDLLTNFTNRS